MHSPSSSGTRVLWLPLDLDFRGLNDVLSVCDFLLVVQSLLEVFLISWSGGRHPCDGCAGLALQKAEVDRGDDRCVHGLFSE